MKLFQHEDFDQAILRAAEHFRPRGLTAVFIEKDYYVTEALRIIAQVAGRKVIFKGGTSLSKGWDLIQRFSEDIDIFVDPEADGKRLSKRGIDRELKKLCSAIADHPGLGYLPDKSQTIGGFGRGDRFSYAQRAAASVPVVNQVLVESGTASGREPTEEVQLRSYVGQFLHETGVSLGAEDEGPFPLRLLHYRWTFVEKMFAIHSKVELYKRKGHAIGGHARHYYDLYQLAGQEQVLEMLRSEEYTTIKADYDRISREHFPGSYFHPEGMSFANSEAIYPSGELRERIAREFEAQCRVLCYGPYPTWEAVEKRFAAMKSLL